MFYASDETINKMIAVNRELNAANDKLTFTLKLIGDERTTPEQKAQLQEAKRVLEKKIYLWKLEYEELLEQEHAEKVAKALQQ